MINDFQRTNTVEFLLCRGRSFYSVCGTVFNTCATQRNYMFNLVSLLSAMRDLLMKAENIGTPLNNPNKSCNFVFILILGLRNDVKVV